MMLKHVGEISNTSKRCAIVFLQLPESPGNALVIETESLPDRYHQAVMSIIESTEGQAANSLADILARRLMPDTGLTMLETLHRGGFLQRVPVDNVNLIPRPNVKHSLRSVLESMGNKVPTATEKVPLPAADVNFYQQQAQNQSDDQKLLVASGYIQQATFMEEDAARLRAQAYGLAPSLRPTVDYVHTEVPVTAPVEPVTDPAELN